MAGTLQFELVSPERRLASLEATAWRFSWREIEYVVEDYPDARVRIEIETLSREQAWLGV